MVTIVNPSPRHPSDKKYVYNVTPVYNDESDESVNGSSSDKTSVYDLNAERMVYDLDERVAALFNYNDCKYQYSDSDETPFYVLPASVPETTMTCIVSYLKYRINDIYNPYRFYAYCNPHTHAYYDQNLMDNFDYLTLFNIIKAAHYLKITSLMGLTCESFVNRVKIKMAEHTLKMTRSSEGGSEGESEGESEEGNLYWNTDRIRRANLKLRFARKSEFGDVQVPSLVVQEFSLLDRRVDSFKADAHRFMVSAHINEKEKYIRLLQKSVYADPCLADVLDTEVIEFLIQILKNHAEFSIKSGAISIISRATSESSCQKMIEDDAVPELVYLISSEEKPLAIEAVNGLIRLAHASDSYLSSILKHNTIQAVQGIVNTPQPRFFIEKLAQLLATICYNSPFHFVAEKELALILAKDLLRWEYDSFDLTTVHALDAISYLSYRRYIPIQKEICSLFVMFIANVRTSPLVAGSALRIIGNVAAFGDSDLIEILTKECNLLRCLGTHVLTCDFKKFVKEGCKIISNLAAHHITHWDETYINVMYEADLMEPLYNLLTNSESDVKMEAAWAIANGVFGDAHTEFDYYEQDDDPS